MIHRYPRLPVPVLFFIVAFPFPKAANKEVVFLAFFQCFPCFLGYFNPRIIVKHFIKVA